MSEWTETRKRTAVGTVNSFRQNGMTVNNACEDAGIHTAQYYRWRREIVERNDRPEPEMDMPPALTELEDENERLRAENQRLREIITALIRGDMTINELTSSLIAKL